MDEPSNVKEIHVLGAVDNNYTQHLGVAFASLLINMAPGTFAHLYVISTGITEENQSKLERTVSRFNTSIQFIRVNSDPYNVFYTSGHISRAAYLRLAIPDVLPLSVEKGIYLDGDVVVNGNIVEMWETDLRGHAIAAVSDIGMYSHCKNLQIPEGVYFNSGIMYMNLSKWREESISSKVMDYLARNSNGLIFHDQDALNAVLYNDWLELSPKWNVQPHMLLDIKGRRGLPSPAIIHYTGSCKPWHFEDTHVYKKEYYKYLRMTEWKSFKPEINMNRFVKRVAKQFLPYSAISILKKVRNALLT